MAQEKVVTLTGSATGPAGTKLAVTKFSFSSGLNVPWDVQVAGTDLKDAQGGAVDVHTVMRSYADWAGQVQTALLTKPRLTSDSEVTVDATGSGKFKGLGLCSGASYTMASGQVQKVLSITSGIGLLAGWQGDIYATLDPNGIYSSTGNADLVNAIVGGQASCCAVMLQLLTFYDRQINVVIQEAISSEGDVAEQRIRGIHAANTTYVQFLRQFLQANVASTSMGTFKDWYSYAAGFIGDCHRALTASGNSLQMVLNNLRETFGVAFISRAPTDADPYGAQLMLMDKFYGRPEATTVEVVSINEVRLGTDSVIPVRGVKCNFNLGAVADSASYNGKDITAQRPVYFPPDLNEGWGPTVVGVNPPSWMMPLMPLINVDDQNTSDYTPGRTPMAGKTSSEVASRQAKTKRKLNSAEALLQGWLALHYVMYALGGCTTSITIPLNLAVESGKTFNVSDVSGVPLFTGFATSVTHNIEISQGTGGDSGSATTTIAFQFIRGLGFSLPGMAI